MYTMYMSLTVHTHTHTHSVSLESSSDSDDDADSAERGLGTSGFNFDDFRPLPRFGHDSLRGNRRGNDAGGSRKKNNKGKAASMSKVHLWNKLRVNW